MAGGAVGLIGLMACSTAAAPAASARTAGGAKVATTRKVTTTRRANGSTRATATRAAGLPDFGNPAGHFYVPPAGRAVNTSHPNQVIGHGTPASCTSAAVVRAVAAGGIITFSCGPKPVTIVMTATAQVIKTRHTVVLDGGGLVTLSGGGRRRILYSDTCAGTWSTDDCVNQPYPQIVVQNITFEDGNNEVHQATCSANAPPCWYGGVDGGGAKNRPVYITSDTFSGGRCSNGGALSSISVQWDVLNSVFTDNKAIGWGANPAASGTPGGGSGGAIYLDGTDDNVLITGTVMHGNTAREGGGAIFDVVDSGWGSLTLNESHLRNDQSGEFQTFPGIYYDLDGHDGPPIMIHSTDS
jgi:hypothetical protein